ncbi:MAG: nucleoside-diphosphate sugar epimerase [Candidatus Eremiobacteraeota bacterium]|nr:nucleoside-diphosphate sugar epimerase [Candidatus Eremiobacteraeota bacterium]
MKRIAVTGAAGYLGRAVNEALVHRGAEAVGIVRRGGADGARGADLSVAEQAVRALDGVDAVVHTASSPALDAGTEVLYMSNVVEAARRTGAHVVYVSIINVDRNGRHVPYYRAKFDAEQLLVRSGVPYTIQRAAQFHAYLSHVFGTIAKLPLAILPPGAAFQPIDVHACADRLAVHALGEPLGVARDVAGPETRSGRELFTQWARATHRNKPLVQLPLPVGAFRAVANRGAVNDQAEPLGPTFASWLAQTGGANPYDAPPRSGSAR